MMAGLWTLGYWKAKPGKADELRDAWQEFASWTSANVAGADEAFLLQDNADPLVFYSFGPWESAEAVGAWRSTPEFQAFARNAGEICEVFPPHSLTEAAHVGGRRG